LLGGVLFSFSIVPLSKIPTPVNATLTGFPTFHPEFHNYNVETWYTMLFFTGVIGVVQSIFILIWSAKYQTINFFIYHGEKTPTTSFNYLIAGYVFITGTIGITYIIFDLGKFWTALAIIHSFFEVTIMLLLHQRGNFNSNYYILPWSFLYLLISEGVTILSYWPLNAFWFNFQGYDSLPQHASDDGRERESEEHDRPNHHINHHGHILHVSLLPVAALFHVAGNGLNTIFLIEGISNYLSSYCYGFMFTALCLFVYLDTHLKPNHPKRPIFIPDTSISACILIITASIALSALCLRL
ncbi:11816_t:CDS:2, partial [Racocetra persica]